MANSHVGKGFTDTRTHYRNRRRRRENTMDLQRVRRDGLPSLDTVLHTEGTCRACGGSFEGPELVMDGEGGFLCLGCEGDLEVGARTRASIWGSVGVGLVLGLIPCILGVTLAMTGLAGWGYSSYKAACGVLMVSVLAGAWSVVGILWGLGTAHRAPALDEVSELVEVRRWERTVVLLAGFGTVLAGVIGLLGALVSLLAAFLP